MKLPSSRSFLAGTLLLGMLASQHAPAEVGINDPIHQYWTATPRDRFSLLKADLAAGRRSLDTTSELRFLESLLEALEVPVSSQMLVYSVTSLQKNLVSPRRPRALYFSDDTYVGYVPGGQIEVISLDPDLGGIFYIFDDFRPGRRPQLERSEDCMRCHSPRHMEGIPGLVVESVVPGITGGGEKAFRREVTGHGIPLDLRFGGWHVTGAPPALKHWGNLLLIYTDEGRKERPIHPGDLFKLAHYPRTTSDVLPQLLHEHQVGFVNRAVQATYRARVLLQEKAGNAIAPEVELELDRLAHGLVRYLLFADEAPLPAGGIAGEPEFKTDFAAARKAGPAGNSLRDLELGTRLLKYRCSYMIYSPAFAGLQSRLKERVFRLLEKALSPDAPEEFAYLPGEEREAIRQILQATLPEGTEGWGPAVGERVSDAQLSEGALQAIR